MRPLHVLPLLVMVLCASCTGAPSTINADVDASPSAAPSADLPTPSAMFRAEQKATRGCRTLAFRYAMDGTGDRFAERYDLARELLRDAALLDGRYERLAETAREARDKVISVNDAMERAVEPDELLAVVDELRELHEVLAAGCEVVGVEVPITAAD